MSYYNDELYKLQRELSAKQAEVITQLQENYALVKNIVESQKEQIESMKKLIKIKDEAWQRASADNYKLMEEVLELRKFKDSIING